MAIGLRTVLVKDRRRRADSSNVLQMDRDQDAPTMAAPGMLTPAEVAEALARRNRDADRRAGAIRTFNWLFSLVVIVGLVGGAWWLSGEITRNNPAGLKFLLGSNDLPEGPFERPVARSVDVVYTVALASGTTALRIETDPTTTNGRMVVEQSPDGVVGRERVLADGQLYEREPNQTGWTVRPAEQAPDIVSAFALGTITMFDDVVPDEARGYVEVLDSRREIVRGVVTRTYSLSIDQAPWAEERPTSYARWAASLDLDPAPVAGGARMTVSIDESGVVRRLVSATSAGGVLTQELVAYGSTPFQPSVPPQAWPIG